MKIFFIGIGGIGISALAQYMQAKGHKIFGSDLCESEMTQFFQSKGVEVFLGHSAENIKKISPDLVIYNPAIRPDNPELMAAKKLKIQVKSSPKILGEITKQYFTIAVCGSHGKSTTAAMLALTLIKANLDPTVIIGTKMKELGNTNFRQGKSKYLIIEADEYKGTFLNYWPKIIILTSIEADHLDYFKTFKKEVKAYESFVSRLPADGHLIASKDNKVLKILNLRGKTRFNVKEYSLTQTEAKKIKRCLRISGEHNVLNALAVLETGKILRIRERAICQGLRQYKNAWRRLETHKLLIPETKKEIIFISDYGHHPTQILATLKGIRENFPKKRVIAVFQPHQYQRTQYLMKDFVINLRKISDDKLSDIAIIIDIYDVPGRETPEMKDKISSSKLVNAVKRANVMYLPKTALENYLLGNLKGGEVVVIMSAGDFYRLAWPQH